MKIKQFLFITLFIFLLSPIVRKSTQPTLAQQNFQVFVQDVSADFPTINVAFRALAFDNTAIDNLETQDIAVYENGQLITDFTLTPQSVPTHTIFVFDVGQSANFATHLNNTRTILTDFVATGRNYFRDGVDIVEVRFRTVVNNQDQTVTVIPPTHDIAFFRDQVNQLSFESSKGPTQALETISEILAEISADPRPVATTNIILLTPFIDDIVPYPTSQGQKALAYGELANSLKVHVHTLDTTGRLPATLETLADASQGINIRLDLGTYITADINPIYSHIQNQRAAYLVSYQSNVRQTSQPQITILPANRPLNTALATEQISYTINLDVPEITLHVENNTIERQPTFENGISIFEPNFVELFVTITWNENTLIRPIQDIQLWVKDGQTDNQTPTPITLPVNTDQFIIDWSIAAYMSNGTFPLLLQLKITDTLGISNVSPTVPITIVVSDNRETANTISTIAAAPATEVIEGGLETTPPMEEQTPDAEEDSCDNSTSFECLQARFGIYALWIGGVFAILLIITRKQPRRLLRRAIGNTMHVNQAKQPLARLMILEGPPDQIGQEIYLYNTSIKLGRDPQLVHHAFFEREEKSTVSREHCSIDYERGAFKITDDHSSNGTKINDIALTQPSHVLQHGDIILLGVKGQQSVQLAFYLEKSSISSPVPPTDVYNLNTRPEPLPLYDHEEITKPAENTYDDALEDSSPPLRRSVYDSEGTLRIFLADQDATIRERQDQRIDGINDYQGPAAVDSKIETIIEKKPSPIIPTSTTDHPFLEHNESKHAPSPAKTDDADDADNWRKELRGDH